MKSMNAMFLAITLTAAMIAPIRAESISEATDGTKTLTILGTSDMHGNVLSFSYENNAETTNNGMARLFTYIEQTREEDPEMILIDAGDDIQGTILTDDIANKQPEKPHPVMTAMNLMGYDAMALGNHEFNWGVTEMKQIISQAEFPVLCANFKDGEGNLVTGGDWTIVERKGAKVAIIGVTTPNVPRWDGGKEGIDDLVCEDAAETVKECIAEIGDQADIIVVAAHLGLEAEFDLENGSDSAQKILDENPEVDVLQVGHYHETVAEKQGDVTVGGVRSTGKELARYDLVLDENNEIVSSNVEIINMDGVEPDAKLYENEDIMAVHQQTLNFLGYGEGADGEAAKLGSTTAKFQPENEILGLPEGKLQDTAVMDFINNIQLEYSGADVSASALFKDTSDLPEGDLTYGNIFDIYKFDNTLYRVRVTGAELKAYMEWSAQAYNQWVEGDINISFNPDFMGSKYDMFQGVDYEIDLSQPVGKRIKNVFFHGKKLADDQTLTLAVNNYRFTSALKGEGLVAGEKEWESSQSVRDMIVEYLAQNSPVEPTVDNNWKITGVDLQLENPQRQEIIDLINTRKLATPYNASYNLSEYNELISIAESGTEPDVHEDH